MMNKVILALGMLLNFSILQAQVLIKVEMDEAVIAARKFPWAIKLIANQVSVISAKEIAQANQANTADLLQNSGQVLVQKSQQGGGSPIMRGFEANKILLVVDEDEFNTSTNPSAVDFVNLQNVEYTTSFEGTKRTSKYDAAVIKNDYYSEHTFLSGSYLPVLDKYITSSVTLSGWGGFDYYEYSSSIDPTGSFIAPYVTTIGLYDENMDMVAVAKLATPIKSTPDLPVNFLVRIDT